MNNPLAIIPTYVKTEQAVSLVTTAVKTLRKTVPDIEILLVDDKSSDDGQIVVEGLAKEFSAKAILKTANTGFADTCNIGLEHALEEGKDAILVNSDIQFVNDTWLPALQDTDASVVGALLTFQNGLVQHAGVFYSLLTREPDHMYYLSPSTLDVVNQERECPVTGALMYIRHECLEAVGLLDSKNFAMGWDDVDYCIRVMDSGRKCVYQPKSKAIHHESMFRRGKNTVSQKRFEEGLHNLRKKHAGKDMSKYCPTMIEWPEL